MTRNGAAFALTLLVGIWGCTPASEQKDGSTSGKQGPIEGAAAEGDPHSPKQLTPDEFGRALFEILKNNDHEGVKRYLWQEQDFWMSVGRPGYVATLEQQEAVSKRLKDREKRMHADVTDYHDWFFKVGAPSEQGESIRTVEYVRFIPGRIEGAIPTFVGYIDNYLVIKINGTREQRLEVDYVQVINGTWRISEIR